MREQRERLLLEPTLRLPTWVLKARQAHYKVRSELIIARMRLNRSTHVRTRTWPSNGRQSPGNNAKQERTRRYMSDGHWHARVCHMHSNRCLLMGAFSVHASSARQSASSSTLRLGPHGDVLRMHDGIADTGGLVCRSGSWEPRGTRQRWAVRQESARLGMPLIRQPLLLHWRWRGWRRRRKTRRRRRRR